MKLDNGEMVERMMAELSGSGFCSVLSFAINDVELLWLAWPVTE
jgi:hypothetical protein